MQGGPRGGGLRKYASKSKSKSEWLVFAPQPTPADAVRHLVNPMQDPMSEYFLSVEPESRSLLESHTNTLLTQFDTQLNILTNRYLSFFQERSVTVHTVQSYINRPIFRRSIEAT